LPQGDSICLGCRIQFKILDETKVLMQVLFDEGVRERQVSVASTAADSASHICRRRDEEEPVRLLHLGPEISITEMAHVPLVGPPRGGPFPGQEPPRGLPPTARGSHAPSTEETQGKWQVNCQAVAPQE
jgi:hypothetical protein